MDYNNVRWEHMDKRRLFVGVSCFTMWLRAIVYPFGLIKTRMQAPSTSGCIRYVSTFDAFSSIVRHEGSRALYQGFWVNSVSIINSPIYLCILEGTRNLLIRANSTNRWISQEAMEQRVSGIIGGLTASLVISTLTVPIGNIAQRLMVHQHEPSRRPPSALCIAQDLYRMSGARGFYRGYVASLMTHAPAAAIFWGTYHPMKANLRSSLGLPMHSTSCWDPKELSVSVTAGAMSSIVSALLTNPIDVVRVRMQLTNGPSSPTIWGTFRSIIRTEGLGGLGRGMAPRMLSTTISVSLASGGYEAVKRMAVKPREVKDFMLQQRA